MGYYMSQRAAKFRIPADKTSAALAAIKALAETPNRMSGGQWGPDGKKEAWYSWVTTSEFVNAKDIKEAIEAWRWNVEVDEEGNVVDIYFDGEKLGDDQILLEALAPFVEDGSYIEMSGEEDAFWRWEFRGGELHERSGRVVFDEY